MSTPSFRNTTVVLKTKRLVRELGEGILLRAHPLAWIILLATVLFAWQPFRYDPVVQFKMLTGTFLLFTGGQISIGLIAVLLYLAIVSWTRRGESLVTTEFREKIKWSQVGQPHYLGDVLWFVASLSLVLCFHFFVKISIHAINPRLFDSVLATYDRALFFGSDPSSLCVSLIENHTWLLHALDILYSVLYMLAYIILVPVLALYGKSRETRLTFSIAYVLLWVVGGILYVAFPSWGPVFTDHGAFSSALRSMPLTDNIQKHLARELYGLLTDPMGSRPTQFGGVAAFPSLHVAVCLVFAWSSRTLSRWLHVICVALLVSVFFGSMATGYHYFFDALSGLVLGLACCLVARWWASAFIAESATEGSPS